jgi:putative heme-binding domain-containing protein
LQGIGTHAPSEITYRIPKGLERLRGRVGPDHGGVSQRGDTLLEFLVYMEKPPKTNHLLAWQATLLDAAKPLAERTTVAATMASDRDGGRALLGLLAQGKIPAALRPTIAAAIFKNPDQTVRLQASKHFPIPGTESLKLPSIEAIAKRVGVPGKGKAHFTRVCAACHVFGTEGKDIGPNLTQIHKKYGKPALLESILNPDAGISFGYENWVIEKKNGEFLLGFILAEGETLVVKDQEGKRHVIPATDVKSRHKSPTSLMPAALITGMSAQDLADLAAYLLTH